MKRLKTGLAFDRASVRSRDDDGRLHVVLTNISKANICSYLGSEIPDADRLGLRPDRRYRLLRDPVELTKAAPTFNNLPLLSQHVPVSAGNPRQDLVVGSLGTDAVFQTPYLKNSLVVWDQIAIDAIESGEQRELSCAYRYVADMTPGRYQGQPYDGVMRDIRGNHVALVAAGRAGPDVVVGDSLTKDARMKNVKVVPQAASPKGAVRLDGLVAALKPFLTEDVSIPEMTVLLSALASGHGIKPDAAEDDEPDDLESEEDRQELDDEDGDLNGDDDLEDDSEAEGRSRRRPRCRPAMDAALRQAEHRAASRLNAIREAERLVRPIIGDLTQTMDSPAAIYRLALDHLQVDVQGVHPSAYPALLKMTGRTTAVQAMDRQSVDRQAASNLSSRFPKAVLIKD